MAGGGLQRRVMPLPGLRHLLLKHPPATHPHAPRRQPVVWVPLQAYKNAAAEPRKHTPLVRDLIRNDPRRGIRVMQVHAAAPCQH